MKILFILSVLKNNKKGRKSTIKKKRNAIKNTTKGKVYWDFMFCIYKLCR